jgi:hypothetical protein
MPYTIEEWEITPPHDLAEPDKRRHAQAAVVTDNANASRAPETFPTTAEERRQSLKTFFANLKREDFITSRPRKLVSTIHHELTHLNSARATRLGWILGEASSEVIAAYREGRPLTIPSDIERVFGAYIPLLEGLALYTELDFIAAHHEIGLPNPVTLFAQRFEPIRRPRLEVTFLSALQEAVVEIPYFEGDGLLRLLFLDRDRPDLSFYLAGYLWVKAAATWLGRRCPTIRRPTRMLPLLNKLICDHPAILEASKGTIAPQQLINEVRATIIALDTSALERIAALICEDEKRINTGAPSQFDQWDLHHQLRTRQLDRIRVSDRERRDKELQALLARLPTRGAANVDIGRALAQIYILRHTTGIVSSFDWDTRRGTLVPEAGAGGDRSQSFSFLAINELWLLLAKAQTLPLEDERLMAEHIKQAIAMQDGLMQLLHDSIGKSITLATYMTLIHPADSGIIAWANWDRPGGRSAVLPMSPRAYDPKTDLNLYMLMRSAEVSVSDRIAIASQLAASPSSCLAAERQRATQVLMADLASDPVIRMLIVEKRFRRIAQLSSAATVRAVEKWVAVPGDRGEPWRLDENAVAELERMIDLPRFALSGCSPVRLRDVLPVIPVFQA